MSFPLTSFYSSTPLIFFFHSFYFVLVASVQFCIFSALHFLSIDSSFSLADYSDFYLFLSPLCVCLQTTCGLAPEERYVLYDPKKIILLPFNICIVLFNKISILVTCCTSYLAAAPRNKSLLKETGRRHVLQ